MGHRVLVVRPVPDIVLHTVIVDHRVVKHALILESEISRFGATHGREQREARDVGVAPRCDELDLRLQQLLLGV